MIPYDLVYLRPTRAGQAVQLFEQTRADGLEPAYYAGGTEILSFIRRNKIHPHVLIDIKGIPECRAVGRQGDQINFGAALTLNELIDADLFALLSAACRRIADHTVRNRLTLGGNICGRLPYREAVLPLLVGEAEAEIAGPTGSPGGSPWECCLTRGYGFNRESFCWVFGWGGMRLAARPFTGAARGAPGSTIPW